MAMVERQLHPDIAAALNPTVLEEFLALVGPGGAIVLRSIIATYLEETPAIIASLAAALQRADLRRADDLAHRLKGSSLSIGAFQMAARCARIEDDCEAGRATALAETPSLLWSEFYRTEAALRTYMAAMAA